MVKYQFISSSDRPSSIEFNLPWLIHRYLPFGYPEVLLVLLPNLTFVMALNLGRRDVFQLTNLCHEGGLGEAERQSMRRDSGVISLVIRVRVVANTAASPMVDTDSGEQEMFRARATVEHTGSGKTPTRSTSMTKQRH